MVYAFLISIYHIAIRVAALWNPKARLWLKGRAGVMERIENQVRGFAGKTVWVHCASLGEFEMARPVMEVLKAQDESLRIVLTFFSPSGYEVRKDYAFADHVFYLPRENGRNAKRFVEAVRPDVVVFVKYDLWWHYLKAVKEHGSRLLLISAVFTLRQHFFKWYGGHGRRCLALFDRIYAVDVDSEKLLHSIGISQVTTCGDTRYDRVMEVAGGWSGFPAVERFKGDRKLVVCGSTWPEDEAVLEDAMRELQGVKWILAPHEVGDTNIKRMERMFPQAVRFSGYTDQDTDVLLIDSIGMLARLYGHADVAYVGGGFGRVLHNILEATAYGIPVVFGPDHATFPDAGLMVQKQFAFSVSDSQQLSSTLRNCLADTGDRSAMNAFMQSRRGAKETVLRDIFQSLS